MVAVIADTDIRTFVHMCVVSADTYGVFADTYSVFAVMYTSPAARPAPQQQLQQLQYAKLLRRSRCTQYVRGEGMRCCGCHPLHPRPPRQDLKHDATSNNNKNKVKTGTDNPSCKMLLSIRIPSAAPLTITHLSPKAYTYSYTYTYTLTATLFGFGSWWLVVDTPMPGKHVLLAGKNA